MGEERHSSSRCHRVYLCCTLTLGCIWAAHSLTAVASRVEAELITSTWGPQEIWVCDACTDPRTRHLHGEPADESDVDVSAACRPLTLTPHPPTHPLTAVASWRDGRGRVDHPVPGDTALQPICNIPPPPRAHRPDAVSWSDRSTMHAPALDSPGSRLKACPT